jgi:hypothetical protein
LGFNLIAGQARSGWISDQRAEASLLEPIFSAFTVVRDISRIVGPCCRKVLSKGLGASRIRREAESGLAFKRTQRQTDAGHDGIPRALFFLRIGEIKAVDDAS